VRTVIAQKKRIPIDVLASIMVGATARLHAAHEARSEADNRSASCIATYPRKISWSVARQVASLDSESPKLWRIQTTRTGSLKASCRTWLPEQ